MYYKLTLRKNVFLGAEALGPAVNDRLQSALRKEVEATFQPGYGLVVAVVDIRNPQDVKGRVLDTGKVLFELDYVAVVWATFRGDVVDGQVTELTSDGFLVDVGAVNVYVSEFQLPDGMSFVPGAAGEPGKFATGDEAFTVSPGTWVRVSVIQETPKNDRFGALGTISGDGLGPRFGAA